MTFGGSFRAGFEDLSSTRWPEALSSLRHDVYHLPSYVGFAARRQETGTPLAFVAQGDGLRFFVPLIVRPVPDAVARGSEPIFDATCPRGYPGPIVSAGSGVDAEGFVERAATALREQLRGRSIVSAFMRLHPLLVPPLEPLRRAGAVVDHGESVSIDLSLSRDEMWRLTRNNHRRDIDRAARRGYVARIDEAWQRFDGFVNLYAQSMDRLGATPFWHLPREYFVDLRASLGGVVRLCVVEIGNELAAAALLTEVDGIVEYHLAGTSDAHVAASPSKLIIDFARQWAKERGNRVLHLAGSLRTGDPLSHFKAGFSPLRHTVSSWRVVADPAAYDALRERWQALAASATGAHNAEAHHAGAHHAEAHHAGAHHAGADDDFFPAYRRPLDGRA